MPSFHVTRVKSIDLDDNTKSWWACRSQPLKTLADIVALTDLGRVSTKSTTPSVECVQSAISIGSMQWISIMNLHSNVLLQEADTTVNICVCSPAKDWDFWAVGIFLLRMTTQFRSSCFWVSLSIRMKICWLTREKIPKVRQTGK